MSFLVFEQIDFFVSLTQRNTVSSLLQILICVNHGALSILPLDSAPSIMTQPHPHKMEQIHHPTSSQLTGDCYPPDLT